MRFQTLGIQLQTQLSKPSFAGAGIGGLALAMALHKKSMSFTLYEAAAEYSTVGYAFLSNFSSLSLLSSIPYAQHHHLSRISLSFFPFSLLRPDGLMSSKSAGIGFAPNGLAAMDAIEPTFRPRYEAISIGNADASAQNVFFEGLLLEEGLGVDEPWYGDSSWGHEGFSRKSVSLISCSA